MENQENNNGQLQIELKEEVAQGTYANLAIITHSSSEFILDIYPRDAWNAKGWRAIAHRFWHPNMPSVCCVHSKRILGNMNALSD